MKKNKFYQCVKIPEIEGIFSNLGIETTLNEIIERLKLSEQDRNAFIQHSQKFIYDFDIDINRILKDLRKQTKVGEEKIKVLGVELKEMVQIPLKNALKEYYETLDKATENVFYESRHFKVTDKLIHYSQYPSVNPPQPINQVSHIEIHSSLLKTTHTVTFEVFIPGKGRWGTVDRSGVSFRHKKEVFVFVDILKKAIACNNIRLKYNND